MRKLAILLSCTALLSIGPAAAGPVYRVGFHFAKDGANDQTFSHDRMACVRQTTIGNYAPWPWQHAWDSEGYHYVRHADAFYQCMTAKGYRADPNGPFKVSVLSDA